MDESHFRTLREISQNGTLSQRDLADRIGLSLGMVNYIVRRLIERGYIKAMRFKNSRNKIAYMYVLTPHGLKNKVKITCHFLEEKKKEYERLSLEIAELTREVGRGDGEVSGEDRGASRRSGSRGDGRRHAES